MSSKDRKYSDMSEREKSNFRIDLIQAIGIISALISMAFALISLIVLALS